MSKKHKTVNIFSLVLLLIMVILFLKLPIGITLASTTGGCGEYWGGNWTILASTYCGVVNQNISVSKHLVLQSGSTLELNGTTNLIFGFKYRAPITITNPGSTLTNYTINVTLNTASLISAGKMRSDCGDIRFGDADFNGYPYWIESGCNSANTKIWIKLTTIPAGTKTIYIFYGNPFATSISNGNATFDFFDDFSGTSVDTSKWVVRGSPSVSGGTITLDGTDSAVYTSSMTVLPSNSSMIEANVSSHSTVSGARSGMPLLMDVNNTRFPADGCDGAIGIRPSVFFSDGRNGVLTDVGAQVTSVGEGLTYFYQADISNSPHILGLLYSPTTTTSFFIDGTNVASSTNMSSYAMCVGLATTCTATSQPIVVDWIRVRKYASPEPTAGTPGTEENNLPQYIYIYSGGRMYIYSPAGINKP
jgi:hypothetical protein